MRIAAQLYTVTKHMQTPEDIRASLKKVREIGYDAVQLSGLGKIDPKELKGYLDENGLDVCATHNDYQRFLHDADALIADNELWGCKYIGLGAMPNEYRTGIDGIKKFASEILPAARYIKDAGFQFVYHNHNFDFIRADGKYNVITYLAENSTPEEVGFLADMFWVQAAGVSPLDFIKQYKDRLDVVHLKDMTSNYKAEMVMAEIGEGNMDYVAICNACKEAGVSWAAVEQDVCPGDPFDSLAISYRNLQTINR